jgi:hypothetical protein
MSEVSDTSSRARKTILAADSHTNTVNQSNTDLVEVSSFEKIVIMVEIRTLARIGSRAIDEHNSVGDQRILADGPSSRIAPLNPQ